MGHLVGMVDVGLRYERIWRAAVGLLAAIGVLSALVFVSPATNLAAFLVAALTIGAVYLSIGLGRDLPNADLVRAVPRGAVLGALCVLAVCGYAAAVGARTVMLLLVVLGASPPVISWLRSGSSDGEPAWTGRATSGWGERGQGSGPARGAGSAWGGPHGDANRRPARPGWGKRNAADAASRRAGSAWDERHREDGAPRGPGSGWDAPGRGDGAPQGAGFGWDEPGRGDGAPQAGSLWDQPDRGDGSAYPGWSKRDEGAAGSGWGKSDRGDGSAGGTHFGWLRRRSRRVERKLPTAPSLRDLPMPKYLTAVVRSVGELTDEELCLAWRRSFTQLERAVRVDHRQAMVDVRRAYLDELERRHPDSFATWLASNPRAAGNPARFFTHRADH